VNEPTLGVADGCDSVSLNMTVEREPHVLKERPPEAIHENSKTSADHNTVDAPADVGPKLDNVVNVFKRKGILKNPKVGSTISNRFDVLGQQNDKTPPVASVTKKMAEPLRDRGSGAAKTQGKSC
jgi:hypothetical protein